MKMLKLGALWVQTSKKSGNKYLSGKLSDGVKIVILPNETKASNKSPSHYIFLAEVEQGEKKAYPKKEYNRPAPKQVEAFEQHEPDAPHPVEAFENSLPDGDDNIPF